MDCVFQIKRLYELREVVGVGVHVVAVPGLTRSAVSTAVVRDAAVASGGQKNIWSSQASALKGQPWLKTTGRRCPSPYNKFRYCWRFPYRQSRVVSKFLPWVKIQMTPHDGVSRDH